jgi:hypothetical protein
MSYTHWLQQKGYEPLTTTEEDNEIENGFIDREDSERWMDEQAELSLLELEN